MWRRRHMGQPLAIVTSQWPIVPPGIGLWTHDVEGGASWRDCDNLWSPELFGTWLHQFAYRGRMIHYGTLGDQTIYTRFGLICLFTLLFRTPVFQHGASLVFVMVCYHVIGRILCNGLTPYDAAECMLLMDVINQQVVSFLFILKKYNVCNICRLNLLHLSLLVFGVLSKINRFTSLVSIIKRHIEMSYHHCE